MHLSFRRRKALTIWWRGLKGYVFQLPKSAKYAPILKNSVVFKEVANDLVSLMKDLAAVEKCSFRHSL
jgi:hypothetical protein